jgi:NOL1/NOP2/fmu family ribosome biogenesis protein
MRSFFISNAEAGIIQSQAGYRFYPHRVKGEGFFISAIQKTEAIHSGSMRVKQQQQHPDQSLLGEYLESSDDYQLIRKNDELYAFPKTLMQDIIILMDRLYVRKAGIHLGTLKGKDLVPSHELALSINLKKNIPRIEIEKEGFSLGWIKVVGNRVNNYFPKNQRILKL